MPAHFETSFSAVGADFLRATFTRSEKRTTES